jgi:LmbE family N-acetylglucosaminyl deacetylase
MVVAPHPDDEAIGCGGYIYKNVQAGNKVVVVFLTDGGLGIPGVDRIETVKTRYEEMLQCKEVLGYQEIWFAEPDGSLAYSDRLVARLKLQFDLYRPDTVLVTHDKESHQDHRVAAEIVKGVLKLLDYKPEVLTYEVWTPLTSPRRTFDISDVVHMKQIAIEQYASQNSRQAFEEAATGLNRYRGVMSGNCLYAECFGRLRVTGGEGMKIAAVLFTYTPEVGHARAHYAERTLTSLLENLSVGVTDEFHVHIADDGSPQEHIDMLTSICERYGQTYSFSQSNRRGYGGSYNMATQILHGDYDLIFPIEDDWQLLKPLDLGPIAKAIEESNGEIRCVRLGYLGFTAELRGKLVYSANQLFLLFDPTSPEHHVFAGHPRLETVDFERGIGPWPENLRAGDVEWEVTHRYPARVGVVWPLDLAIPAGQVAGNLFGHIGSVSVSNIYPEGVSS